MIEKLCYFIQEREKIRIRRAASDPSPWTEDPILQQYKFCNVHREDDRVTIWVRKNIREPFAEHPNLWFMLCIARQINWVPTLAELMEHRTAWPHKTWNPDNFRKVLLSRQARKEQVYTGAYMLNCNWGPNYEGPRDKPAFTAYKVLGSVWKARRKVEPQLQHTMDGLKTAYESFLPYHGWGSFMSAQVVADLKYTRYLSGATDWYDWAASGPGSRRGLNVVLGREPDAPWREPEWLMQLQKLKPTIIEKSGIELHAQDLQNCLCEFHKYVRGWSRVKFTPHKD